jgi:hypothetical protein
LTQIGIFGLEINHLATLYTLSKGLFAQSDRLRRATQNRIDPICAFRVAQHLKVSYDTKLTLYLSDCVNRP